MSSETPSHLTPREVAADLGVSVDTLRRMRERGDGPAYIEVSERNIRYPVDDFERWKQQQKRNAT
jgi:predicted DNA-binding transcriptional regulator AlpA